MKNYKLFELKWVYYDECVYFLFIHENKTYEEFDKDICDMLIKYGDEYLAQESGYASLPSWIEYIAPKMCELGYELVEPKSKSFWGGYIISEDEDENKELINTVGRNLYNKSIEHNSKIRNSYA